MATLLVLPAVGCAQDSRSAAANRQQVRKAKPAADRHGSGAPDAKAGDGNSPRRLESVTWNSVKHELTWVISKGEKKGGASYQVLGSENYLINMDDATMSYSGETRRFSRDEASNVHVLMDLIAKYAVDSTVWWDDGQGEPLDGGSKDRKNPHKRRERNGDENVPTLHVSWGAAARSGAACPARLAAIRLLEHRLEMLKRQQNADGTARVKLASYSPDRY
ncbi:MAG TPA: hypothetical protein VF767_12470 [Bryobacteraceae bacterium]